MDWYEQCEWAEMHGYRPAKCSVCGGDIFVKDDAVGPHYCYDCERGKQCRTR